MKPKKLFNKSILSAQGIIFLIICLVLASKQVNRITTNSCFSTLQNASSQAANVIYDRVLSNTEQLNVIADLLAQHEDLSSETTKSHISLIRQQRAISAVGILLSDNRLVLGEGKEHDFSNTFDYENELTKIPYISGVTTSPYNAEKKYIYQAVPIEKEGNTIGILYGFIFLDEFADHITLTAFDGNAKIFVADGETGDVLVDTWHERLGNVFDESIIKRKVKPGYDYQEMKQDFVEGKAGHIAFWSNTAGEYLYSYYQPIGVNKWMVQLTVPESIVFARAIKIKRILYILAIAETLMFLLCFVFAISGVLRNSKTKENQLKQTRYMYDVQKTLFEAHKDSSQINMALQKVSQMLTAKSSFLMVTDGIVMKEIFSTAHSDKGWMNYSEDGLLSHLLPYICSKLAAGETMLLYSKDIKALQSEQDKNTLKKANIFSLMFVPVLDSSNKLIGILGSINMKKRWHDATLLNCVMHNFMMALRNIESHRQIENMGIIDVLTDLKNRNSYEKALDSHLKNCNDLMCCLYIDADGLHNLNNTLGHTAGDEMLIYIADSLKASFETDDIYRIGGDEFTVFCTGLSENALQKCLNNLRKLMEKREYHISIGKAWLHDCTDVKDMIKVAENNMYEEKRLYYKERKNISQTRIINQKLDQTVL